MHHEVQQLPGELNSGFKRVERKHTYEKDGSDAKNARSPKRDHFFRCHIFTLLCKVLICKSVISDRYCQILNQHSKLKLLELRPIFRF